jgi:hypothetical protein
MYSALCVRVWHKNNKQEHYLTIRQNIENYFLAFSPTLKGLTDFLSVKHKGM